MNPIFEAMVQEYQCPGCVCGSFETCGEFKPCDKNNNCSKHVPGTVKMGAGTILLGFPRGFSRVGPDKKLRPWFYLRVEDFTYDIFNVPVWKYRDEHGRIIVKGFMPRINQSFLQVFNHGDISLIPCREITDEDLKEMD